MIAVCTGPAQAKAPGSLRARGGPKNQGFGLALPAQPGRTAPVASAYLTQGDADAYGHDLLDVSQHAALHAISPHLETLQQQNASLQARLAREQKHRMDQELAQLVPNFREIDNNDPNWHTMSGRVRQTLLNDAIQKGSVNLTESGN
jgi:hypothetical protein